MNFDKTVLPSLLALTCGIVGLLASNVSKADSYILGGASYHVGDRTYTYKGETNAINEVNPSFGYRNSNWETSVVYIASNSFEKESLAIAWNPRWDLTETVEFGLRLGASSGYSSTPLDSEIVPIAGVDTTFDLGRYKVVLGFLAPEVITIHLEIPL